MGRGGTGGGVGRPRAGVETVAASEAERAKETSGLRGVVEKVSPDIDLVGGRGGAAYSAASTTCTGKKDIHVNTLPPSSSQRG